jgi:integrase
MRGHVRKRGSKWLAVLDLGHQAAQQCEGCRRRYWTDTGKRLEACPKCGGTLRDVVARRQQWLAGFDTEKAAGIALTEELSRIDKGTHIAPTKVTVGEYLTEWLDATRATVRPSTWDSYAMIVRVHVTPKIGSIMLQSLSASALNSLYADLLAKGRRDGTGGLSPRSVRYVHTVIQRALADAVRWNRLTRNVAQQANPPRARTGVEMKTWSAGELGTFLAGVRDDRLYAAWLVAATTGLRRGEVLGLRWADVDLAAARLSVRQTLIHVGYKPQFSVPKTAKGRRLVALDAATVATLKEHRRRQLEERLKWGPLYHDQDLVFAKEDGSVVHPDRFSDRFETLVARSGLPNIRLHDLRHTHATLALRAGIHPKVVSERLGHSTISITLDTYSHAIPAMQEEAAEKIAALVFGH